MGEKDLCMLKQMLGLSESNLRKFLKKFLCQCLLNVINGNFHNNKHSLTSQEDSFQQSLSKEASHK